MKNILFASVFTLIFGGLSAQTVTVEERDMKVDKISRTGLAVTLDNISAKFAKNLWKKKLKEYGKVESHGSDFAIESGTIPAVSSRRVHILAKVESNGKGAVVWWAIDLGDKWVRKSGTGGGAASKILHDFGVSCYQEAINEEIEAAEKNLEKVTKEQEKVVKTGDNLVRDLENNAQEKIDLEQKLKKNGEDKIQLEKDIEQNKKDQENMKVEVGKAQKAVETVKAKLDQVK